MIYKLMHASVQLHEVLNTTNLFLSELYVMSSAALRIK